MYRRLALSLVLLCALSINPWNATGSRFTGFTPIIPLSVGHDSYEGSSSGDQFGRSVAGAGDVNGDGVPDVVIGSREANPDGGPGGSARVVSGADASVLYTFYGDVNSHDFGASVAGAGDVNADGYADLIVGDPTGNGGDSNEGLGQAFVYSGFDGSILYTLFGTGFFTFGESVAAAGDVNYDGYADVIVGEPNGDYAGTGAGKAYVFSGATGAVLFVLIGDSADDYFGVSVAGAGDVNGDGYPDVVVGALQGLHAGVQVGLARVHSGLDGSALFTFHGESELGYFGQSVAGAGDVNGDGFADIIVGAPNVEYARVYSGFDGAILHTFLGDSPSGGYFGWSVAGAGDMNGDGRDDLIVGDRGHHPAGRARVFSGDDGSVLLTVDGDAAGDHLGFSVAGAGDLNRDGYADVIIGAIDAEGNDANSGKVEVFGGGPTGDTTPPSIVCPGNLTIEATSPLGATVTFGATASDEATPLPLISYSSASGSTFPLGTTTIEATAIDEAGNSSSCSFTVTVLDRTAPLLVVPGNQIVEALSPFGSLVPFTATAVDAVTLAPTITYSQSPGTGFPIGVRTVTVTASDAAGNTSSGSFTVTVRDTTPPTLIVPSDITVNATSGAGAVVTYRETAVDLVTPSPTITRSHGSGATFPLGSTTVRITAMDGAGNSATKSFKITVRALRVSLIERANTLLRTQPAVANSNVNLGLDAVLADLERAQGESGVPFLKTLSRAHQSLFDLSKQKMAPTAMIEAVMQAIVPAARDEALRVSAAASTSNDKAAARAVQGVAQGEALLAADKAQPALDQYVEAATSAQRAGVILEPPMRSARNDMIDAALSLVEALPTAGDRKAQGAVTDILTSLRIAKGSLGEAFFGALLDAEQALSRFTGFTSVVSLRVAQVRDAMGNAAADEGRRVGIGASDTLAKKASRAQALVAEGDAWRAQPNPSQALNAYSSAARAAQAAGAAIPLASGNETVASLERAITLLDTVGQPIANVGASVSLKHPTLLLRRAQTIGGVEFFNAVSKADQDLERLLVNGGLTAGDSSKVQGARAHIGDAASKEAQRVESASSAVMSEKAAGAVTIIAEGDALRAQGDLSAALIAYSKAARVAKAAGATISPSPSSE